MNELKKFILNFLSAIPELTFTKKHLWYKLLVVKADCEFIDFPLNKKLFTTVFTELRSAYITKLPNRNRYKLMFPVQTNVILLSANQRTQLRNLHEATSQWGEKKTIYYYNQRNKYYEMPI